MENQENGTDWFIEQTFDALLIMEDADVNCLNRKNEGVMHACGHDGHTLTC